MSDEIETVRARFIEYSEVFNLVKPDILVPFFYVPSLLMTPELAEAMKSEDEVKAVFTKFMGYLTHQNFTRSELHEDTLTQKMLADNIAIVSGVATRFKKDEAGKEVELETIGVTYTLRKDYKDNMWKIITGINHKPETAIAL
jgi:nitric oxide reductase activation protein